MKTLAKHISQPVTESVKYQCRFCSSILEHTFCNLGSMPLANSYLKNRDAEETWFPLHALVCSHCFLVQLIQFHTSDEIFTDYAYFSSYSTSWVTHAQQYVETIIPRCGLDRNSFVIEIASNDGYLLQHFKAKNIPILGIEPAVNVAKAALNKGIPTISTFFGKDFALQLASDSQKADLVIGNNVLAHVPNLQDFIAGLKIILSSDGIITLEFPHLLQLICKNQFDTIYHEHFFYFSLFSVEKIFKTHLLEIFDADTLPTHGGSLRLYIQHLGGPHSISTRIADLKMREVEFGLTKLETYSNFWKQVMHIKEQLNSFLKNLKLQEKVIVGYGAPAKGNTLLNYCGVSIDLIPFTVDKNPHKQGCYLPGSRIPIYTPQKIEEVQPDYLLILPWNLKKEIQEEVSKIRNWKGQFVVPIPKLTIEK